MSCNVLTPSTAVELVEEKINQWNNYANQAFSNSYTLTEDLSDLEIVFNETSVNFSVDGNLGSPFSYQEAPDLPDIDANFSQFLEPVLGILPEIGAPNFRNIPDFEGELPSLHFPAKPVLTSPTAPGDAPTIDDVTVPDAPDVDSLIPSVPSLTDIDLPTAPTLDLPTFSATAPTNVPQAPSDTFSFTEESYSTDLLTDVTANIRTWLEGGTGLPTRIWNAIWDRARSQESKSAKRSIEEAENRFSSRGYSYPPGAYNKVMQEINQEIKNKESELAREIAIKAAEMEQTNLHFAIQQGIALENVLITLFNERMQRAFETARYAFQSTVEVFNAKITLYNAQYQAFKVEADVYRTRIEAELSRLETFKAEIDAQRLVSEVNNQVINLYNSQLQSVLTHIEIYKGQLAGVQAQVEVDKTRMDAFTARVRAYAEEHNANAIEVQAYAEQIKAEITKADLYRLEVDAYSAEIKAYQAETDLEAKRKEIEIAWQNQELERYVASIDKYKAQISTEIDRIRAGALVYDARSKIYATEIGQEEARTRSDEARYNMAIQEGRAEAELNLQSAQINIENLLRTTTLELDRLKTIANVQGSLASSALSAVSVGASLSSQDQTSHDFNFSCA